MTCTRFRTSGSGQQADLVFVAPATADLLARAATGRADDLLTATLLTARCPVVFAPAMHTEMWEHPATQANVATLRGRGCLVLDPAAGPADRRRQRAGTPARASESCTRRPCGCWPAASRGLAPDLGGRQVLVSAGGTREELDPVRFLGNWSSGRQGYALAPDRGRPGRPGHPGVRERGAPRPGGRAGRPGRSRPANCGGRGQAAAAGADAVVMAAAVADFRPETRTDSKIKKAGPAPGRCAWWKTLTSCAGCPPTGPGPVRSSSASPPRPRTLLRNGQAKLAAKGCDLLVVNQVGAGLAFGTADNEAIVLGLRRDRDQGAARAQGSARRRGVGPRRRPVPG